MPKAERQVVDGLVVHVDHPGLHAPGEPHAALDVIREDAARETVRRVVHDGQRVLVAVRPGDRRDRTEDLLARAVGN